LVKTDVLIIGRTSRHADHGSRILLVEDDEDIGAELVQALTSHGHCARLARSGGEALSAVAAERPDLVLLDLGLPDIDGVALCRRLRVAAPDGVIVVLTARTPARRPRRLRRSRSNQIRRLPSSRRK
jgi:DNA-binding response OmpR family regulator